MIAIVREHNLLNGYRFALVEYGVLALGLSVLVAFYLAAARWLDAVAWLGIVANFVTIAGFAVTSILSGAVDHGTLPMRDRDFRRAVARSHPGVWRRTTLLIVTQCVPFLLATSVVAERFATAASPTASNPG